MICDVLSRTLENQAIAPAASGPGVRVFDGLNTRGIRQRQHCCLPLAASSRSLDVLLALFAESGKTERGVHNGALGPASLAAYPPEHSELVASGWPVISEDWPRV